MVEHFKMDAKNSIAAVKLSKMQSELMFTAHKTTKQTYEIE